MTEEINKRGPKPEFIITPKILKKIRKMAGFMTQQQMWGYFGVCRDTWYDRKKKHPEIAEAIKKGKPKRIYSVASKLMDAIDRGGKEGVTAAIFFLKTQGGWTEKKKIEVSPSKKMMELPKKLGSDPITASQTYQKIMGE